jgi:hypothetical protein
MSMSFKSLTVAAVAFGAVAIQPDPASAQRYRYGAVQRVSYGPNVYYRPVGVRSYAPRYYGGYRSANYGPRYYGGYRSAYYGPRYYGGYPYRYYRRGYNGGAVAAGLIGGLALGAIASAAANPYYYRPAYYAPTTTCFTERRRIVNRYGRVTVRRVQTCY